MYSIIKKVIQFIEKTIVLFCTIILATLILGSILGNFVNALTLSKIPILGLFAMLAVPFYLLFHYWKTWNKSASVFVVLLLLLIVFFAQLIISSLISVNSYEFPYNVQSFSLFILFLPFLASFISFCFFGFIYGAVRGLVFPGKSNAIEAEGEPRPKISKRRKIVLALIVIVGVLSVVSPLVWTFHTGTKNIDQPHDSLLGKKVHITGPLVYLSNCVGCGESEKELQINRKLQCAYDTESVGSHYFKNNLKTLEYVPSTSVLEVVEVYKVHNYGITSIDSGPGNYKMAVLKDGTGKESFSLSGYIEEGKICTNPTNTYDDKLFAYLENHKKTRVNIIVFMRGDDSKEIQQQTFIDGLPKEYTFKNITKGSTTKYKAGFEIQLDLDADALAFLWSTKADRSIFSILGMDAGYIKTLSALDQEYINADIKRSYLNPH